MTERLARIPLTFDPSDHIFPQATHHCNIATIPNSKHAERHLLRWYPNVDSNEEVSTVDYALSLAKEANEHLGALQHYCHIHIPSYQHFIGSSPWSSAKDALAIYTLVEYIPDAQPLHPEALRQLHTAAAVLRLGQGHRTTRYHA